MIIGATTCRPMELPLAFRDWHIVDTGNASPHEPVLIKLPVFVAVGAVPIAGVITPLVGKAYRYPIVMEGPKLLDEAIIELPFPLSRKELNDGFATRQEFSAVAPDTIPGVCQ